LGSGKARFCFSQLHFLCISTDSRFSLLSHRWTHHEGRKLHGADTLLSTPEEADNVPLTAESAHSVALAWHRATGNVSTLLPLAPSKLHGWSWAGGRIPDPDSEPDADPG